MQLGERWSKTACDHFLVLEEGINLLPGLRQKYKAYTLLEQANGYKQAYGYVLKKEYEM